MKPLWTQTLAWLAAALAAFLMAVAVPDPADLAPEHSHGAAAPR